MEKGFDAWFLDHAIREQLVMLMYARNWDYKLCSGMSTIELIVSLDFPPQSIDKTNPLCHVITLQSDSTVTSDMMLEKWNMLSITDKEKVKAFFDRM